MIFFFFEDLLFVFLVENSDNWVLSFLVQGLDLVERILIWVLCSMVKVTVDLKLGILKYRCLRRLKIVQL